ncbi:unnamed protein product [Arctogadus glacialis]
MQGRGRQGKKTTQREPSTDFLTGMGGRGPAWRLRTCSPGTRKRWAAATGRFKPADLPDSHSGPGNPK